MNTRLFVVDRVRGYLETYRPASNGEIMDAVLASPDLCAMLGREMGAVFERTAEGPRGRTPRRRPRAATRDESLGPSRHEWDPDEGDR